MSLSDLKGGMSVVLFNLNSGCTPCVEASGAIDSIGEGLNAADERFDVNLVQLLGEGGPSDFVRPASQMDAAAWASETGTTLPVLHGGRVFGMFTVRWMSADFWVPAFGFWIRMG